MRHTIKHILALFWYGGQRLREKIGFPITNQNYIVPILYYHSVAPNEKRFGFRISPDNFKEQINYLTSHYNVIPLSAFVNELYQNKTSKNTAVITFDDGYRDNYIYAYPILRKYNCPATIFVSTGFIDGEINLIENHKKLEPLKWSEIREMKQSGLISFGAHSHTHRILTKIPPNEIDEEIKSSRKILEEKLNEKIKLFAYPNGNFNQEIINLLKNNGFIAACSTICGNINFPSRIFFLNRVQINERDDLEIFELKLKGGYNYIWYIHTTKHYLELLKK